MTQVPHGMLSSMMDWPEQPSPSYKWMKKPSYQHMAFMELVSFTSMQVDRYGIAMSNMFCMYSEAVVFSEVH